MDPDKIKEAFGKAKQDIQELKETIYYLSQDIQEIKRTLQFLSVQPTNQPTQYSTIQHTNPSQDTQNSTEISLPTQERPYYGLKEAYIPLSTRNEGVPTNQPTNQQTNQHPPISTPNFSENKQEIHQKQVKISKTDKISHLEQISTIISTLDDLKKELRIKFKRLTSQEMLIFSTIYQLEENGFTVDYSLISEKLGLSEISVRDYIHKLI